MKSWDRFVVPQPFTRAIFVYGDPIHVPRDITDDQAEEFRLRIEETLNRLGEQGEREFDELWSRGVKAEEKRR